jgi:hypothetical protein
MSWGLQTERVKSSGQKGAYIVKPVLNTRDDIEKIAAPPLVYDEKTTQQNYELEADLFGDILDVKLRGIRHISFHIPSWYISFRGLEQMYLDFYSDPDFVHAVFKRFKEGYEKTIFEAERQNLLELNNDETYHASGGLGYTRELPAPDFDHRHVRLKDMWGSAESQEMSSVSPEMHRAFPFPYEKELLSHFGLTGYGCCEALHDKLDFVLSLPNIRRISISPWGDVEKSAGILGSRYIFSWKPNPTYISSYYNEEEIRNYLQDAIKKTRNCQLEILLKDTHTCRNEPERFEGWMKIARSLL